MQPESVVVVVVVVAGSLCVVCVCVCELFGASHFSCACIALSIKGRSAGGR